jgi:hypothetical protein
MLRIAVILTSVMVFFMVPLGMSAGWATPLLVGPIVLAWTVSYTVLWLKRTGQL